MNKKGFTLVEIMIVVAIIGLLVAIAIPSIIQARARMQANACIVNLKDVQKAVSMWALDNSKKDTDTVMMSDLVPKYLKAEPYCPLDNKKKGYVLATVGVNPACPNDPTNHKIP